MQISDENWKSIVKNNPIFSIDIIFLKRNHSILMGKRLNEPAKGKLFVPGGRVFKNETREQAFERISKSETGLEIKFENSLHVGIFEHFYENSKWSNEKLSTHYIVEARIVKIDFETENFLKIDNQHSKFFWIDKKSMDSPLIHEYCYPYFHYVF